VSRAGLRLAVGPPADHGCDWTDERAQIRSARAIEETFAPPETVRIRSVTRNQHMARRLPALRREGSVAAVVGITHPDPLADCLDG